MHVRIHMNVHACECVNIMSACICAYMHVCVLVCVSVDVYVYVCVVIVQLDSIIYHLLVLHYWQLQFSLKAIIMYV